MDNYFSKNLKYLRSQMGLSLADLSAKIGCGKSVLSNYENGTSQPTLPVVLSIIRYFGCDFSDITERDLSLSAQIVNEPDVAYGNAREINELKDKLIKCLEEKEHILKDNAALKNFNEPTTKLKLKT